MKEAEQRIISYRFRQEVFYGQDTAFYLQVIIWGHVAAVLAFDDNQKWFVLSQTEVYEEIDLAPIVDEANQHYPDGPIENWGR